MSVDLTNPYQSPSVSGGDIGSPKTAARWVSTMCIPPMLAIGCTLVLWLGLASVLGQMVAAFNTPSLLFVWSSTLFFSVAVSVYLIIRVWPRKLSPVSMSVGFVLFGVVFWWFAGDTSNGTDFLHMSTLYGTLVALPAMVFMMTRSLDQRRPINADESTCD